MKNDEIQKLQAIKNDYIKLEIRCNEERETFLQLTRTLLQLLGNNDGIEEEVKHIRQLLENESDFSGSKFDESIESLRRTILHANPTAQEDHFRQNDDFHLVNKIDLLSSQLSQIIKKLLQEFYPLSDTLLVKAEEIARKMDKGEEIDQLSPSFLAYVDALKVKIADDHEYISRTVMELFQQFRELEYSLFKELSMQERMAGFTDFEEKFDHEYSSLIQSLNPKATISDIQKAIVNKFERIKGAFATWKKKENDKVQSMNQYVNRLKSRVINLEQDARKLTFIAKKFQHEAMTDKLTGLYSKHTIETELKKHLQKYVENKEPFSLILFDVDRFKQINDSYGHIAGDTVLSQVAACLKESFRTDDFLARFGGDEFVAIVSGFSYEMARSRLDIFRENLKKRKFKSKRSGEVKVTASAGIAVVKPGDTTRTILERADQAMYNDKKKM